LNDNQKRRIFGFAILAQRGKKKNDGEQRSKKGPTAKNKRFGTHMSLSKPRHGLYLAVRRRRPFIWEKMQEAILRSKKKIKFGNS